MRHGGLVDSDVVLVAETKELLPRELRPVVGDDRVGDPKAVDDVGEECHGLFRSNSGDRSSFYPLGELIHGDNEMGVALGRPFERSDQIKPLDHE